MIAAAATVSLLSSCSLRVKVTEKWNDFHSQPIPLGEATRTWREMREGGAPEEVEIEAYNAAVRSSVAQIASNWSFERDGLSLLKTADGEVNLRVNSVNVRDVHLINAVVPADILKVKRGFRSESAVKGIGTALLVRQPWTEGDPMIPSTGLWYPVTAILNLDKPESPALELIDPTKQGKLSFRGHDFPLSANYTAAFARDFHERQYQFSNLAGLLNFEKYADRIGLYRASAFDPAKTPCIFVHGINSSPSTWDETINRLCAVEGIRERYEFWTFGYPTGAPIPYMSSRLREAILEMIEFRRAQGAANETITMVGHSMGGLLSKAVTISSGDKEWNQLFNVPIDQLKVSDSNREILRKMIYFEPIPEIDRVIFCATPHNGAKIVENPGAKLVGDLIQVPSHLVRLSAEIINQSAYALTPLGMEYARDRMTSIEQLRSSNRPLGEFFTMPLNPAVTYHSIIGNSSLPHVPLEKSSDGVVSYASAHIEGVASEVVVKKSMHGVHRTDGGIREIIRILNLP